MQSIFGALLTAGYAAAVATAIAGRPERRPDHEQHPGPAHEVVLERRGRRRAVPAVRDGDHGRRQELVPRRRRLGLPGRDHRGPGRRRASSSSSSRSRTTRSGCSPSTTPRTRTRRRNPRPEAFQRTMAFRGGVDRKWGSRRNDPGNDGRGRASAHIPAPTRPGRHRPGAGLSHDPPDDARRLDAPGRPQHEPVHEPRRERRRPTRPSPDPISKRISIQVVDALGVQERLEARLPDAIKPLAGALAASVTETDRRAAPGRPPGPTAPGGPGRDGGLHPRPDRAAPARRNRSPGDQPMAM